MKKTGPAFLVIGIVCLGCLNGCKKESKYVYLDLKSVVKEASVPKIAPLPLREFPSEGKTREFLEALPAQEMFRRAELSRNHFVEGWVAQKQQEAFDKVLEGLEHTKELELRKMEEEELSLLAMRKKEALEKAFQQIRDIFLKYAEPIGEAQYFLAAMVRFPDPDPLSQRAIVSQAPWDSRRTEHIKKLRSQIQKLDVQFWKEVHLLLWKIESDHEVSVQTLKKRVLKLLADYRAVAGESAKEILKGALGGMTPQRKELSIRLPALASEEVQLTKRTLSPVEKFSERRKSYSEDVLKVQAELWADLNGYQLTNNPKIGKNLTQEFIRWKKQYELKTWPDR